MADWVQDALGTRMGEVAQALAPFSRGGGLTVVVVGGLGRGRALSLPVVGGRNWYVVGEGVHDLAMLLRDPEWDLLRVWHLLRQERATQGAGIVIRNPNGLLNLAAYWAQHAYCLVPAEMPFLPQRATQLVVGSDFIRSFRAERRREDDVHAAPVDGVGRSVFVRRLTTGSFFAAMRERPIYAAEHSPRAGVLAGVVEAPPVACWVVSSGHGLGEEARDFQRRVWEATLEWLDEMLAIVVPILGPGAAPAHIELRLLTPDAWDAPTADRASAAPVPPAVRLERTARRIIVELSPGFVALVARATNDAERALVRAIAEPLRDLFAPRPDHAWPTLDALVDETFGGPDARKLHVLQAQSAADPLAWPDRAPPLLIAPEHRAFWELGLAWHAMRRPAGDAADADVVVDDQQLCVRVLRQLVDHVWRELQKNLAAFNREATVVAALENWEAITRERSHWSRTARALTALPSVRAEAADVAANREGARAVASAATRAVLEMAVCVCPPVGGAAMSRGALGHLIAGAALILDLATEADALQYGPPAPGLRARPNGFVDVQQPWIAEVAVPFRRATFAEELDRAVAGYDRHVPRPRTDEVASGNEGASPAAAASVGEARDADEAENEANSGTPYDDPAFVAAFVAEYELTPRQLVEAVALCTDWALERDRPVLSVPIGEFAARLRDRGALADRHVAMLLRHFALTSRPRWDEAPAGFRNVDWYPWRFRRRLSLVARPFVHVTGDDVDEFAHGGMPTDATRRGCDQLVFSAGQINASARYLLEGLRYGWFHQEFVASAAMRQYLGHAVRTAGAAFTAQVADVCRAAGWEARADVPMRQLGAPKALGDVDVLAWRAGDRRLLCIECKRLRPAQTAAEILDVLTDFRGAAKDYLGRHVARWHWLRDHRATAGRNLRAQFGGLDVVPLLVTNAPVPMQFAADLPLLPANIRTVDALKAVLDAPATAVSSDGAEQRVGGEGTTDPAPNEPQAA